MIGAGIISGLLAAPFGWIDWFKIPAGTRAKSIGLVHALGNIVVVVLFAASSLIRGNNGWDPTAWALVCSFAGVVLAVVNRMAGRRARRAPRSRRRRAEFIEPPARGRVAAFLRPSPVT